MSNHVTLHSTLYTPVLIVGGGPAGAATAIALARVGVRVALVTGDDSRRDRIGESLPPSVNPLLQRLGVWEDFLATGPLACHANRSAWGDGRVLEYGFIADPHGHGWHIDRRRFDAMLLAAARGAGARVLSRTRATGVLRHVEGGWRVALQGGETVLADALVDATGRSASVARKLGASWRRADRLVASVAFLSPTGWPAVDSPTLVEATTDGWWYSAALPDGRLVAAFMTDPDRLKARGAGTPDGWSALLHETDHTGERVRRGCFALTAPPRVEAAGSGRLEPAAGDGWLAVGDAAAAFDPLSSHGIGAALEGALRAADAVRAWLAGDRAALGAYAKHTRRAYARYQQAWLAHYAEERRWPDAPFWRRRHTAGPRHAASSTACAGSPRGLGTPA